jgi:beta-hydroxylase
VLNCHLAVAVPEKRDACRLRVGSDVATWEEGRMLIFDDRNEHEAWNDSEGLRVVLLVYVVRPLPFPLSALNRTLLRLAACTTYARNLVKLADEHNIHAGSIEAPMP